MKVNRHRKTSVVSSLWNHAGYTGRLSTEPPSPWRVFMKASPVLPGDASESLKLDVPSRPLSTENVSMCKSVMLA